MNNNNEGDAMMSKAGKATQLCAALCCLMMMMEGQMRETGSKRRVLLTEMKNEQRRWDTHEVTACACITHSRRGSERHSY